MSERTDTPTPGGSRSLGPDTPVKSDLRTAIAVLSFVAVGAFVGATAYAGLGTSDKEIMRLDARVRTVEAAGEATRDKLARIETKLDMLLTRGAQ